MKPAITWLEAEEADDPSKAGLAEKLSQFPWALREAAEVWTDDPAKLRSYSDLAIVDGLLREREIVQIVGAAKLAKSWFAADMGLAIAAGTPFLGFPTSARKVLFLDFELKAPMFAKRLSMLAPSCPSGFHFQALRGSERRPTPAEVAELVKREGFGVCFIDSLYVTGWLTDENDNITTARELRHVQSVFADTGASLVVVDHTSKGAGAERSAVDSSRGASSKGGIFDAVLVLRPTTEGADQDARYAVLDPALRDWPAFKVHPLIAFRWTETRAKIMVEGGVVPASSGAPSIKVLEALSPAGTYLRRSKIEEITGLSENAVTRALKELCNKRRVGRTNDPQSKQAHLYFLIEPSQTASNLVTP